MFCCINRISQLQYKLTTMKVDSTIIYIIYIIYECILNVANINSYGYYSNRNTYLYMRINTNLTNIIVRDITVT